MSLAEKIINSYIEVLILALFLSLASPLYAAPIKVMVIDTGVAIDHPALKRYNRFYFSNDDITPDNIHGVAISSLVLNGVLKPDNSATSPVCNAVELYVCNYKPAGDASPLIACLNKAISLNVNFVNYSSTGTNFLPDEFARIAVLGSKGAKFITAAGNEGDDLLKHPHYPAMYAFLNKIRGPFSAISSLTNITVVGALTTQNTKWDLSNYGVPMQMQPGVMIKTAVSTPQLEYGYAYITGTSASTALYTNKLLNLECAK